MEVLVPDIGGFVDVTVVDVLVKDGQTISKETPLITIETEKAAMDVPAPAAGTIVSVKLKAGDKVSQGSLVLLLDGGSATPAASAKPVGPGAASVAPGAPGVPPVTVAPPAPVPPPKPLAPPAPPASTTPPAVIAATSPPKAGPSAVIDEAAFSKAYASPSIRKFARELGADLGMVTGSGPKGRITQDDVKAHVKKILQGRVAAPPVAPTPIPAPPALPKVPLVDFAAFGPVEVKPLSRIQKISGSRLHASWVNLPHVTQFDEADITELEATRIGLKSKAAEQNIRLTPLAFIVRACVLALKEFPRFNASLDATGENLVFKNYFNIGFAADTPNGLVVPVIPNADRSSLFEIATALATLSEKARAGKLKTADMQGGTFTISSLGGIGGTAFTPIINAPEVAILGVSKSAQKPLYQNGGFVPRLMLPLSLSYDHRVIDGAAAARFIVFLSQALNQPKALL